MGKVLLFLSCRKLSFCKTDTWADMWTDAFLIRIRCLNSCSQEFAFVNSLNVPPSEQINLQS